MSSKHEIKQNPAFEIIQKVFSMVSFINTLIYCRYRNTQSILSLLSTTTEDECMNCLGRFWKKIQKLSGLQLLQINVFQDGSSSTGCSSCLNPASEQVPLHRRGLPVGCNVDIRGGKTSVLGTDFFQGHSNWTRTNDFKLKRVGLDWILGQDSFL